MMRGLSQVRILPSALGIYLGRHFPYSYPDTSERRRFIIMKVNLVTEAQVKRIIAKVERQLITRINRIAERLDALDYTLKETFIILKRP